MPVEALGYPIEQGIGTDDQLLDSIDPTTRVEVMADEDRIRIDDRIAAIGRELAEEAERKGGASVGGSFTLR